MMATSLCPRCQGINLLSITSIHVLHPDWHSLELAVSDHGCVFCQRILTSLTQYLCTVLPQIVVNPAMLVEALTSEGRLSALPKVWYKDLETPICMYPAEARVTTQPAGAYEPEDSFIHDYVEVCLPARRCEGRPRRNMFVISCGNDRQGRVHDTYPEQLPAQSDDSKKSRTSYYRSSIGAAFYPFRMLQNFPFEIGSDDPLRTYLNVPGSSSPALNPKDNKLLLKIKQWRDECEQEHPECRRRPTTHDSMPGRLVSINRAHSDGHLSVVQVDDSFKDEYVALSYCWGSGLKRWIEEWIEIVKKIQGSNSYYEFNSLPNTLKDAVEIAACLGYRYIWIDCLCILQGDAVDWANESEKMGYIYESADLIVSATATSDCRQGFLHNRSVRQKDVVRLPVICEPGIVGTLLIGEQLEIPSIDDNPVSSRAWCMQERVLARRVLHCFPDEVYFECVRCRRRESEATRCVHFDSPATTRNNWAAFGDGCGKPTLEITNDFSPNLWSSLVQGFSSRNLTFQSDKLVAIAGMARSMGGLLEDRYLAGHWLGWLIEDLMWYTDEPKALGKRASTWRAPSWSWASMDTPVQPYSTDEDTEYEVNPTIIEASTITAPGRPFGQVNEGKIVLEGQLRSIPARLLTALPRDESVAQSIVQGQSVHVGWFIMDENLSPSHEFLCLRMLTERKVADPSFRRRVEVLLLKQNGSSTFVRLGMASIFDIGLFDDVEQREIVLV